MDDAIEFIELDYPSDNEDTYKQFFSLGDDWKTYRLTGPWADEPDSAIWKDESTNLICVIRRQLRRFHFCGYVGIDKATLEKIDLHFDNVNWFDLRPHGGVTFSGDLHTMGYEDYYFIGFDCNHFFDLSPLDTFNEYNLFGNNKVVDPIISYMIEDGSINMIRTYKTFDFVIKQCQQLAYDIYHLCNNYQMYTNKEK